jgi:hypothetical protein
MEKNLKQQLPTSGNRIIKSSFWSESTGKTTLANNWPNIIKPLGFLGICSRLSSAKWNKTAQICGVEDMLPIALWSKLTRNESL